MLNWGIISLFYNLIRVFGLKNIHYDRPLTKIAVAGSIIPFPDRHSFRGCKGGGGVVSEHFGRQFMGIFTNINGFD